MSEAKTEDKAKAKVISGTVLVRPGLQRDTTGLNKANGKKYDFQVGMAMGRGQPLFNHGQTRMVPVSEDWPKGAPKWISSGDLEGYEEAIAAKAKKAAEKKANKEADA